VGRPDGGKDGCCYTVQEGGILNLGRELCVTRGGLLVSLDSPEHSRIDFIARSTKQRGVKGGKWEIRRGKWLCAGLGAPIAAWR